MNKNSKNLSIYLIGVGGAGMSALCGYLIKKGFVVFGSDKVYTQTIKNLEGNGLVFYQGHSGCNVDGVDIVVYSSAISEENPELVRARFLKKAIYKRSEILNLILNSHRRSIGISGSHGKTTTTAMITEILNFSGVKFTSFIGGEYPLNDLFDFDKTPKFAISEICEYDRNIDDITVDYPVCLNADNDHLDTYGSVENLIETFKNFLSRGKVCFYNADDKNLLALKLKNAVTFGVNFDADFKAVNLISNGGYYTFNVLENNEISDEITLSVAGIYNVYNALLAISICRKIFKIEYCDIIKGLKAFNGVKRRMEFLGEYHGKKFYGDYAHHPTEIKSVLTSFKDMFGNDFSVIFQPHTYSRTKLLFGDFISAFCNQNVLIYKEYPSREVYDYFGSAERLANAVKCPYLENANEVIENIKNSDKGAILILGAGDLYEIVLSKLKNG